MKWKWKRAYEHKQCVASKAPANTQANGNSIEILQMPFVASCKSLQVAKSMLDLNAVARAEAGKWRRGGGGRSWSSIFSNANTKATNRRTIEPTFRGTSQSSCCSPSFSVSTSLSLSLSLIVFLHCFCLWHTHNECNKRKRQERQTSTVERQRKIKTLLDMANNLIFQLMKIWKWKWKAQKGTQLQRQRCRDMSRRQFANSSATIATVVRLI